MSGRGTDAWPLSPLRACDRYCHALVRRADCRQSTFIAVPSAGGKKEKRENLRVRAPFTPNIARVSRYVRPPEPLPIYRGAVFVSPLLYSSTLIITSTWRDASRRRPYTSSPLPKYLLALIRSSCHRCCHDNDDHQSPAVNVNQIPPTAPSACSNGGRSGQVQKLSECRRYRPVRRILPRRRVRAVALA